MTRDRAEGFPPVFDGESELLILGSFPSVRSRAVNFYYGNPQNRFWKTLCGFFREDVPTDTEGKRAFLLRRHIALWDVVTDCEIAGSSDASIRAERVADVGGLLEKTKIRKIFCNGSTAYRLFSESFPQYISLTEKLPSTSPANPRFSAAVWENALRALFPDPAEGS